MSTKLGDNKVLLTMIYLQATSEKCCSNTLEQQLLITKDGARSQRAEPF